MIDKEKYEKEIIDTFFKILNRTPCGFLFNVFNSRFLDEESGILFNYWSKNGHQCESNPLQLGSIINTIRAFHAISENENWIKENAAFLCEVIQNDYFYKCLDLHVGLFNIFCCLKDDENYVCQLKKIADGVVNSSTSSFFAKKRAVSFLIDKKIVVDEKEKEELYFELFKTMIPLIGSGEFLSLNGIIPHVYLCNILRKQVNLLNKSNQSTLILSKCKDIDKKHEIGAAMLDNQFLFNQKYLNPKLCMELRIKIITDLPYLPDREGYIKSMVLDFCVKDIDRLKILKLISDENKISEIALEIVIYCLGEKIDCDEYFLLLNKNDKIKWVERVFCDTKTKNWDKIKALKLISDKNERSEVALRAIIYCYKNKMDYNKYLIFLNSRDTETFLSEGLE